MEGALIAQFYEHAMEGELDALEGELIAQFYEHAMSSPSNATSTDLPAQHRDPQCTLIVSGSIRIIINKLKNSNSILIAPRTVCLNVSKSYDCHGSMSLSSARKK